MFTATEGSGADADATSSTYGPGAINGVLQGTDTTNRFSFTLPTPGGVSAGVRLTATARLGGNTSEFSAFLVVTAAAGLRGHEDLQRDQRSGELLDGRATPRRAARSARSGASPAPSSSTACRSATPAAPPT